MLEITAAGMHFVARWEDELAPKTVAAFKAILPLDDQIIHCRWSGESNWIPWGDRDLDIGPENATSYPHPGELALYPGGQSGPSFCSPTATAALQQGRAPLGESLRHPRRSAGTAQGARRAHTVAGRPADLVPRVLGSHGG